MEVFGVCFGFQCFSVFFVGWCLVWMVCCLVQMVVCVDPEEMLFDPEVCGRLCCCVLGCFFCLIDWGWLRFDPEEIRFDPEEYKDCA